MGPNDRPPPPFEADDEFEVAQVNRAKEQVDIQRAGAGLGNGGNEHQVQASPSMR